MPTCCGYAGSMDVGNAELDSSVLVRFHLMNQFSSPGLKKIIIIIIVGCRNNGAEET